VTPDLDAGDMVEVFDEEDSLWKCAEVECAPADGSSQFRVKLVGAPKVLTVAPSLLRLRQILRDDDVWVLLHKVRGYRHTRHPHLFSPPLKGGGADSSQPA
jgi:hypothetical protein